MTIERLCLLNDLAGLNVDSLMLLLSYLDSDTDP